MLNHIESILILNIKNGITSLGARKTFKQYFELLHQTCSSLRVLYIIITFGAKPLLLLPVIFKCDETKRYFKIPTLIPIYTWTFDIHKGLRQRDSVTLFCSILSK